MKRKKDDKASSAADKKSKKYKKFKPLPKKNKKTNYVTPHLPKSAGEMSSNWKALQNVLSQGKDEKPSRKTARKFSSLSEPTKKTSKKKETTDKYRICEDIWFDDVDAEDIEQAGGQVAHDTAKHQGPLDLTLGAFQGVTKRIAMDCEFVGIGLEGKKHMLARVSIVNSHGRAVYDKYVSPQEKVADYRTAVSGIRPADLRGAPEFKSVQKEVSDILKGRILIGHALKHDLQVLFLNHPRKDIRDTIKYKPFQKMVQSKTPALKKLSKEILHSIIQEGEHSSVQDAQAAMRLYCLHKREWEKQIREKKFHFAKKSSLQDDEDSS